MNTNDIPVNYPRDNVFLAKIHKCQRCVHAKHTGGSYDDGSKRFCTLWNAQLWIISDRIERCDCFEE